MDVRRAWLWTLGAIGAGSLAYVFVVRGFTSPGTEPGWGLGWPLLGVVPPFVFGVWLLTASSSRVAVYVALGSTASTVGSAYETFLWTNPEAFAAPWFAYLNAVGLTADAVATAGFILMVGSFPDGVIDRRWQRITLNAVWASLLVAPLTLLTMPDVVFPRYAGVSADVDNPVFVPALAWAAPVVDLFFVNAWLWAALGLTVLLSRFVLGDARTRARLRVMTATVLFVMGAWVLWELVPSLRIQGTPLEWFVQTAVLLGMVAVPVAGIHGILKYGAFDVADADRGRLVVRSSSALITVLYGIAVVSPALLLFDRLDPVSAVLLTAVAAVVLLPVRGWLHRGIQRAVLGDRDHHLALLSELGARLEQAMELDEVLARLAEGVRRGLDATWVRVRVLGEAGEVAGAPAGTAGRVAGAPVVTQDLVRGEERLGVLELGPRTRGTYGEAELSLLETVARQATTTVANVRLTARLNEQLEQLSASRQRLITAQDEERRRIERDLHDGIQQSVVALIASLGLARQRQQRGELAEAELVELQDQARETLADLRELAHGIHPQVLTDRGLVAAVESRTNRFPVPLVVVADDEARRRELPPDVEAVAFYTVREALANVAKHADASSVRVTISVEGERLHVEVADDGSGLAVDRADAGSGGLVNIRDRVAAVGGRLVVEGMPGTGTRLAVDLPLSRGPALMSAPATAGAPSASPEGLTPAAPPDGHPAPTPPDGHHGTSPDHPAPTPPGTSVEPARA